MSATYLPLDPRTLRGVASWQLDYEPMWVIRIGVCFHSLQVYRPATNVSRSSLWVGDA